MLDLGNLRIGIKVDGEAAKSSLRKFRSETKKTSQASKYSAEQIAKANKSVEKSLGFVAKGVGIAATAAATGFALMTKSAVDGYASFEQNIGGINKLFGESANEVVANAKTAWKTAGVDANTYMEQITSFSASLISSLGGDTQAAAKYADIAIKDMSDNANTFGTSIEEIQHAYQGFAKDNFSMLDNLKLGYSGSRSEMERLIADANKVKEANGEMADLSIDSYADMVEAIHIVQEEMGIAGTTAMEAATTIEGSCIMMKAAWQNWLIGLGDSNADMQQLTKDLVDGIVAYASNLLPRLGIIAKSIIQEIPNVFNQIVEQLPVGFQRIIRVIEGFMPIIAGIVGGALAMFAGMKIPTLITTITTALSNLWIVLATNPVLATVAVIGALIAGFAALYANCETFRNAINNLWQNLQPAIQGAMDVIQSALENFASVVQENVMPIIESLKETLSNIGEVVMPILQTAFEMIVPFITMVATEFMNFASGVAATVMPVLNQLIDIFNQFITWISPYIIIAVQGIQTIWDTVFPHLQTIVQSVFGAIQTVIQTAMGIIQGIIDVVMGLIQGDWSRVWNGIKGIASSVWNGIKSVVKNAINGVKGVINTVLNTIKGVWSAGWNVVSSFLSNIWNTMKNTVSNAIDGVVDFFKNLPSNILSALGNLGSLLVDAGKSIIQGLKDGLVQKFEEVKDFVSGIGDWIAEHKGPKPYDLKLLIPNGGWIMESLATGLEKAMPVVNEALQEISKDIQSYDFGKATVEADFNAYKRISGAADDATKASSSTTTINVNNYSPKALTEKESAREFRKSVRNLAFA